MRRDGGRAVVDESVIMNAPLALVVPVVDLNTSQVAVGAACKQRAGVGNSGHDQDAAAADATAHGFDHRTGADGCTADRQLAVACNLDQRARQNDPAADRVVEAAAK